MPSIRERLVDRVPERARPFANLVANTITESGRDRVTGLAAEVAFWVLLSFPPLLLLAAATAGFIGESIGQDVRSQLINRLLEVAGEIFSSSTVNTTIAPTLDRLLTTESASVLSFSFVVTVYSASRVLRVIVHAVTIAYDLRDARPDWVARVLGIAFTLIGLVISVVLIPLLVAGPRLGAIIQTRFRLDLRLEEAWRILYWPVSLLLLGALLCLLYHFAVPWRTPLHREIPGAVLATVMGLLTSVGLRTYTEFAFGGSDTVYAPLAAPLALLLWIWLQAIALLAGAELNAEIERMYPAGEPVPESSRVVELSRRTADRVRGLISGIRQH